LKSASDTVSDFLVRSVLPPEWLALLDVARCDYSVVDGKEVKLEKYSAMGNGYTFELETLLFTAACIAAGSKDYNVFGDDIIVEQSVAPDLIDFLQFLGFEVNESKTCLAGTFFESCGVDVWHGRDVRPFFLKGTTKATLWHFIALRINCPSMLTSVIRTVGTNGFLRPGCFAQAKMIRSLRLLFL